MKEYRWNENDQSATCRVRAHGATYNLYVGELPDLRRDAAWFLRKGRRTIASGIAGDMGKALAQVEDAFEKWASKTWLVIG